MVQMSLLDYFRLKRCGSLPNARGPLSNRISSTVIASANSEVRAVLNGKPSQGSRKGKKHHITLPKRGLKLVDWLEKLGLLKQQENFLGSWVIQLMKVLLTASRFKELYDEKKKEENEKNQSTLPKYL